MGELPNTRQLPGENAMTKERQSHREPKKKSTMTLKEKRNAKKSKREESKTFLERGKPAGS